MSPELEQILMSRLSQSPKQAETFEQRLAGIADEIKSRNYGAELVSMFNQTLNKNKGFDVSNTQYEQSLTSILKKDTMAMMFGASIAGQVGGMVSRFMPINLGISGLPAVIGGWALGKYVLKSGLGNDVAKGVLIGGGAVAMSGFTSGLPILGGLGGMPQNSSSITNNGGYTY